jgi:membrane fusion protein, multidrug efflux system
MQLRAPTFRTWSGSALLIASVLGIGLALGAWKAFAIREASAASLNQPEPVEVVTTAVAVERDYRPFTTSIGTVLSLQSVTLRNEIAGTVRRVALVPGSVVEAGAVLVALDVSVEEAELQAQQAQAALTETTYQRLERLRQARATSEEEVDQAKAARDVALAQMARTRAIIARKTIRAPFRAHVGMADVHPGQYLSEGTVLTTLQGVESAAHVDFSVEQRVAAGLRQGETVSVLTAGGTTPVSARIVAIDARVDPSTRSAAIRAKIGAGAPAPGASVRVQVPVGPATRGVVIPVSALRKGPGGDHVFLIEATEDGRSRAHVRPVSAGGVMADEVMILTGLNAGDRVATSGSFKLRESVLVALANDSTQSGGDK